MKQNDEERDNEAIKDVTKKIFNKNWKIYKIREDKSLPNNTEVVKRIQTSINDGITKQLILKKGRQINEKAKF